jgi:hypothetical protein
MINVMEIQYVFCEVETAFLHNILPKKMRQDKF